MAIKKAVPPKPVKKTDAVKSRKETTKADLVDVSDYTKTPREDYTVNINSGNRVKAINSAAKSKPATKLEKKIVKKLKPVGKKSK